MIRMARLAGIGVILVLPLLFVGSAQALNLVSFVSVDGSGTACTFFAPCAAVSTALDATEPSGEIRCLGEYGTNDLTITKPITFDCNGLILSGTLVNAVTININEATFPNGVVTLRHLTIDGVPENSVFPEAQVGIQFSGCGAALYIEDCEILGFAQQGLNFAPTSSVDLFIRDTIISGNAGSGILINPAASATVRASLNNVRLDRNGAFGLSVVKATAGSVVATLDDVQIENSAGAGILSDDAGANVVLNDSVVTRNGTGITSLNAGKFFSFKSNALAGNGGTNATPTLVSLQ